jgi:molecular chaperone HscB
MTSPEFKKSAAQAAGADYYALLDLDPRYDLDPGELERRYLERSRAVHPDRFVGAPASQRLAALQQSMQLNDAYKTLKQPGSRAEYLLGRRGVTIGDNEILDPTFLMEVLELREELAEARHDRDAARLRALEQAMHDRQDATLERVGALFSRFESSGDQTLLADIKVQLIVLRYVRRYLDQFDDMPDDLIDEEGEL